MRQNDKNLCTLYLVRHGETEWNKTGIVMGQLDSPLTEAGLGQAKTTAQELKGVNFDAIFSSDLHRAHKTAEIIKLERELVINFKSIKGANLWKLGRKIGRRLQKKFPTPL